MTVAYSCRSSVRRYEMLYFSAISRRVVRFAQLEVDQLRSVAFVEDTLRFGRTTFVGSVPGDLARTQHSCSLFHTAVVLFSVWWNTILGTGWRSEVEAVVRSPTNMAAPAAKISAVDFNKTISKWSHSSGGLLAAMFVGRKPIDGFNRFCCCDWRRKKSTEYLIWVYAQNRTSVIVRRRDASCYTNYCSDKFYDFITHYCWVRGESQNLAKVQRPRF